MGRALGKDLRLRVLSASVEGSTARGAGERFGVSASTAVRWISRARQGETEARTVGRRHGSVLDCHADFILAMIDGQKDITLDEMVVRLKEECGLSVVRSTVGVWLRKRGFTYKKRPVMHWSRSEQTF